ncbi:MAG TPA: hypothetical protein VGQ76_15475 [Thermoanaerobaculia bacterium]|jgi:hypothetical protein|nr:hypothetical protein [Thermoanaerobaculia bacterium]
MNIMKPRLILAALAMASMATLSCSSELNDNAAPVELVVTNTQNVSHVDLNPLTQDEDCDDDIGVINMQVIPKNGSATGPFVQVRVQRYRVSYRRTDGGTIVPAPFVRSIDTLIGVGETSSGSRFTIVESDAISLAPFAALQPQNGGRDAETGRPVVQFEVVLEVYGETLGGDNVYDSTAFPLEFCYDCGGCD